MTLKRLVILGIAASAMPQVYGADYFTELRYGVEDSYRKEVKRNSLGPLTGTFKGANYGIRIGTKMNNHSFYLEHNPSQDVEVKSANELAHVKSSFLGYRYHFSPSFFLGAAVGHSSFELEKGPNGVTFIDNPETSGATYGLTIGYKYFLGKSLSLGVDAQYAFGSYIEDGPNTTPVKTIEIQNQKQVNITLGYHF